jgi:cytoskeletal protein RodZ
VSSISLLEQHRDENLAELGNQLRLKRQAQALSLTEVAAKTRIQLRLLQAIESGDLEELPEPIYIQGFIKIYADALGLNGTELANSFPTGDRRLSIKPVWQRLPTAQLRPIHLYLIYIFVIICAVNALSQMLSRPEPQVSSQLAQEPLVSSSSKRQQILPHQSELKSVSATPSSNNKISKPVQIEVNLKAESWIRVVADGTPLFEGLLPQGTQRTWVAQEQLTVRAGNAGGVLVTFNHEKAKQLGNLGEVQEVTFAANSRSQ